jgi:hypothetical protein
MATPGTTAKSNHTARMRRLGISFGPSRRTCPANRTPPGQWKLEPARAFRSPTNR